MKKCFRNDALAKVTGKTKYADDLKFYNMLHMVPVYTDHVHAKINKINTKDAEAMPGVVKIITGKDVPGSTTFGQIIQDYAMLATDKIRTHGDVVALVVATTRDQALEAAKTVTVDLTELPPILNPEKALLDTKNLVHEKHGNNLINEHKVRRGNTDDGFANSDFIIEQRFTTKHAEHAYMEPESAIALLRDDGVIEVHGSIQHHFTTRKFCAAILGCKFSEVEIIGTPMGGGFGGKDDTASIVCARAALAAKLIGQPVKLTYDREWSMRESYKRHPYIVDYKMGFTNDGKIQAMKCRIIADGGAYCATTPFVTWRSTVQCCGPYVVPNVYCDTFGVYTNNVFTGAFRGFGSPQMNFIVDQVIEMAAVKCNMDSIELRKLNMVKQNATTITGQKLDQHTVSMNEVLEKTLNAIDYKNKIKNCKYGKDDSNELYGIGFAMSSRGMSLGAEGMDFCSAIINGQFDGSILLEVGIHENGQGAESAMMLILADELGVNIERIRYRRPSTSNIGDGGPTVASRGTLMGGGAVTNAAKLLKEKIANTLAENLNCKPNEVRFANDHIYGKTDAEVLSWDEACKALFLKHEYPYAFGTFAAPDVSWDEETGQGNAYFTWVYGCQAVELTVNKKTGKIKLLNWVMTHDVGRAINPPMVLGQFYGGAAQGMGYALQEDLKIQDGKVLNDNFHKYRIMRAVDMPEITGIIVENADPTSPSSAKGCGEPTLELAAPAIANAVYNATGKRSFNLPIKIK